jgi:hypothetical protein
MIYSNKASMGVVMDRVWVVFAEVKRTGSDGWVKTGIEGKN